MTEVRKIVLWTIAGFASAGALAWILRTAEVDRYGEQRTVQLAVEAQHLKDLGEQNAAAIRQLVDSVNDTTDNQRRNQDIITGIAAREDTNGRQIGELVAQVRELGQQVARLGALIEKK